MTRPPDPSKSSQIVVKNKPEWETELRAFRELCARNGLEMSREIYVRAIKPFLQEHHWPPGNSQTVLTAFSSKPKNAPKCFVCKKEAVAFLFSSRGGLRKPFCSKHRQEALDSGKWEKMEDAEEKLSW